MDWGVRFPQPAIPNERRDMPIPHEKEEKVYGPLKLGKAGVNKRQNPSYGADSKTVSRPAPRDRTKEVAPQKTKQINKVVSQQGPIGDTRRQPIGGKNRDFGPKGTHQVTPKGAKIAGALSRNKKAGGGKFRGEALHRSLGGDRDEDLTAKSVLNTMFGFDAVLDGDPIAIAALAPFGRLLRLARALRKAGFPDKSMDYQNQAIRIMRDMQITPKNTLGPDAEDTVKHFMLERKVLGRQYQEDQTKFGLQRFSKDSYVPDAEYKPRPKTEMGEKLRAAIESLTGQKIPRPEGERAFNADAISRATGTEKPLVWRIGSTPEEIQAYQGFQQEETLERFMRSHFRNKFDEIGFGEPVFDELTPMPTAKLPSWAKHLMVQEELYPGRPASSLPGFNINQIMRNMQ
jgi:hypothetical protein